MDRSRLTAGGVNGRDHTPTPDARNRQVIPTIGATYDVPTRFNGVLLSNYWRVLRVSGTQRHRVYLQRHGTGERRTVALSDFVRIAKASPR